VKEMKRIPLQHATDESAGSMEYLIISWEKALFPDGDRTFEIELEI
jgi:hypothetical protein